MTPVAQPTPRPWVVADRRDMNGAWWIGFEHPHHGFCSHAEVRSGCSEADELGSMEANAAHIVHCVNSFDALTEANARQREAIRQISILANTPDGGTRNMDRMLSEIADIAGAELTLVTP